MLNTKMDGEKSVRIIELPSHRINHMLDELRLACLCGVPVTILDRFGSLIFKKGFRINKNTLTDPIVQKHLDACNEC